MSGPDLGRTDMRADGPGLHTPVSQQIHPAAPVNVADCAAAASGGALQGGQSDSAALSGVNSGTMEPGADVQSAPGPSSSACDAATVTSANAAGLPLQSINLGASPAPPDSSIIVEPIIHAPTPTLRSRAEATIARASCASSASVCPVATMSMGAAACASQTAGSGFDPSVPPSNDRANLAPPPAVPPSVVSSRGGRVPVSMGAGQTIMSQQATVPGPFGASPFGSYDAGGYATGGYDPLARDLSGGDAAAAMLAAAPSGEAVQATAAVINVSLDEPPDEPGTSESHSQPPPLPPRAPPMNDFALAPGVTVEVVGEPGYGLAGRRGVVVHFDPAARAYYVRGLLANGQLVAVEASRLITVNATDSPSPSGGVPPSTNSLVPPVPPSGGAPPSVHAFSPPVPPSGGALPSVSVFPPSVPDAFNPPMPPSGGVPPSASHAFNPPVPPSGGVPPVAPNAFNPPMPPSGGIPPSEPPAPSPPVPPPGGVPPFSFPHAQFPHASNGVPFPVPQAPSPAAPPSFNGVPPAAPLIHRQYGGAPPQSAPPVVLDLSPGPVPRNAASSGAPVDFLQLLSSAVQGAVQAVNQPNNAQKLPKECRVLANPGHDLKWATTPLNAASLADFKDTCLSRSDIVQACPRTHSGQERATQAVGAPQLLRNFTRLDSTAGGQVSPLDFAEAHKQLLFVLVAAVAALPTESDAAQAAAGFLWDSLAYSSRVTDNSVQPSLVGVRRAHQMASQHYTCAPLTPTPLFMYMVHAMVPQDVYGSSEEDYRLYLIRKFDFTTSASLPSLVLGTAMSIARHKYKVDTAAYVSEVKNRFGHWVERYSKDPTLRDRLAPLKALLDRLDFAQNTLEHWESQLQLMERSNASLAPLTESFLNPALPAPRTNRRAPTIASIQGAGGSGGASDDTSNLTDAITKDVLSRLGIAPSGNAQPLLLQGPTVHAQVPAQVHNVQPTARAQLPVQVHHVQPTARAQLPVQVHHVQPTARAQLPVQVHNVQPGLHPSMATHFAPAVASVAAPDAKGAAILPRPDPALAVLPSQMNETWVAQHGCPDLGPPPNAPITDRPWQNVTMICSECDIQLPESFKDVPHVGGDSCPYCAWLATNQGWAKMVWFVMPHDRAGVAPKPQGRNNAYVHQTFKCRVGLAIMHRVCRAYRDAGKGDAMAQIFKPFTPPALPPRPPQRQ